MKSTWPDIEHSVKVFRKRSLAEEGEGSGTISSTGVRAEPLIKTARKTAAGNFSDLATPTYLKLVTIRKRTAGQSTRCCVW